MRHTRLVVSTRLVHVQVGFDAPAEHLERMAADLESIAERLEALREAGGVLDDERAALDSQVMR
jgi:cell division protein FtsB